MNKTAQTLWRRVFLIERLPEPLSAASVHLQIFDNYIEHTRIRLRSVRDPGSNSWTSALQKYFVAQSGVTKFSEIHLSKEEYATFEHFEGREIRKNRYFHEFDGRTFAFDVYLGPLWGLNLAFVELDSREEFDALTPPQFAFYDISSDAFFEGGSLVDKSFADVRAHLQSLMPISRSIDAE